MESMVRADTRGMTHEEWLAERRCGIGGSDAGAIMGVNPYRSPLAVYMDKLQLSPEKEMNEAMRQGIDLEDYVASRFCEETGLKVRKVNRILQHPEKPWMLANIDRDVVGENSGLECKTASPMTKCDYEAGEIPPSYYMQCLHYMAVTGAEKWYLAVLVYSKAFHVFEIKRDDNAIKVLKVLEEREEAFWKDNVLAQVPPLPTGNDNENDLVNALFPIATNTEAIDITDQTETLQMLQYQKQAKKHLEQNIAELEEKIKMRLGENAIGTTADFKVTWSQSSSSSLDKKTMLDDHPELIPIINQYTVTKPCRRFTVRAFNR